jgi:hypothetical protein
MTTTIVINYLLSNHAIKSSSSFFLSFFHLSIVV